MVHSQGAIIFCAALEHYRINYGKPLTTQQVAVHGSGANIDRLKRIAHNIGVTINNIRNNPFDLVPNVAGRNDLSSSSLVRSIKFMGLVFGKKSDPGNSPPPYPF